MAMLTSVDLTDSGQRTAAALERIAMARRALTQQIATRRGLTVLQVEIIRVIGALATRASGSTALAAELGVSGPTVSDALASLRQKGLTEPSPGLDGRSRAVRLTRSGRSAARAIEADLEPFRRACGAAGGTGVTAALDVIHGLWREGLLSLDRSCATCLHNLPGDGAARRCDILGVALTEENLRVSCPEHSAA